MPTPRRLEVYNAFFAILVPMKVGEAKQTQSWRRHHTFYLLLFPTPIDQQRSKNSKPYL
jgi:hypothetical protein